MIFNFIRKDFEEWENFKGTTFSRRLEFETAFDGIVKVYSLQTDDDKINKLLKLARIYLPLVTDRWLQSVLYRSSKINACKGLLIKKLFLFLWRLGISWGIDND
jgi:hypothetical protein